MKFIARKSFGGTSSSQQATFIAAESFNHEIYDVALAAANFCSRQQRQCDYL